MHRSIPALSLCALCACASEPSPSSAEPVDAAVTTPEHEREAAAVPPPVEPTVIDERFTAALLTAAAQYREWGRVDEHPNLAPVLCRDPSGLDFGFPSHVRLSAAEAVHGRKLYYLFAGAAGQSARFQYIRLGLVPGIELPLGFTVVKESWTAVASTTKPERAPSDSFSKAAPAPVDWVEHDGQILRTAEQAELFVMFKAGAADTPGTDAGWIYGTLSADGKRVTSAGRIEQCMDCHEAATHERLFGLQRTKALVEVPMGMNGKPANKQVGVE